MKKMKNTNSPKKRKVLDSRLPPELWAHIYNFMGYGFPNIYSLNREIHNYPWKTPLKSIKFTCDPKCAHYAKYDFSYVSNLEIDDDRIDDKSLKYFQGIPNLKFIPECNRISDAGLAWLKGVETLDLSCLRICRNPITDEGLKNLTGIRELILNRNNEVTHVGLSYLEGIETLEIDFCFEKVSRQAIEIFRKIPNMRLGLETKDLSDDDLKLFAGLKCLNLGGNDIITAKGMQYISGVKNLNIRSCPGILDEGLSYLTGIHTLDLTENYQLTDAGLSHLKGVYKLNLSHCEEITDVGLAYLNGVYDLDISYCQKITLKGIKQLKGLHTLSLAACKQVKDEFLEAVSGVQCLNLQGCLNFTDNGLKHLKGVRDLEMSYCFQLDSSGLRFLEKVEKLNLTGCRNLSSIGLLLLTDLKMLKTLRVRDCPEVYEMFVILMGGSPSSRFGGRFTFR